MTADRHYMVISNKSKYFAKLHYEETGYAWRRDASKFLPKYTNSHRSNEQSNKTLKDVK